MEFLLTIASIASSSARGLLSKRLSTASRGIGGFGRVNALLSLTALLTVLTVTLLTDRLHLSPLTLVLAVLYAVFTISAQLFYMRALESGAVAAVTFYYSCGFLIPTIAGTVLYHEPMRPTRILGIALLFVALRMHAGASVHSEAGTKRKWILPAILAMISSGLVGLIQKIHQSSSCKSELGSFLILAFAIGMAISLLLARIGSSEQKPPLLPALSCGVLIGAANLLNTRLSGLLPALILFPAINGGVVIATAIAARILYAERLGKRRILALALGTLAIVMVAL